MTGDETPEGARVEPPGEAGAAPGRVRGKPRAGKRPVVAPASAAWLTVEQVAAALQVNRCHVLTSVALSAAGCPPRWPVKDLGLGAKKKSSWRIHRSVIEPTGGAS